MLHQLTTYLAKNGYEIIIDNLAVNNMMVSWLGILQMLVFMRLGDSWNINLSGLVEHSLLQISGFHQASFARIVY